MKSTLDELASPNTPSHPVCYFCKLVIHILE